MSPLERLRWATAPVQHRSLALLWGGIALFCASGGVAYLFETPLALALPVYAGLFAGWLLAALGVTGYLRWMFAQARIEMQRVHAGRMKDD